MTKHDVAFWVAVGIVSIASVAIFKIGAAQPWVPDGLKKLAGSI